MPECLVSIGNYVFSYCVKLSNITIPRNVMSIGYDAFSYCTSLISITIPEGINEFSDGLFYHCTNLTTINIPDRTANIGEKAFANCTSLTRIEFPRNLIEIKTNAFSGCSSLTGIIFPENLTSIGMQAFQGCTSLTSILLPGSLKFIASAAFSSCQKLKSITFQNNTNTITFLYGAFVDKILNIFIPGMFIVQQYNQNRIQPNSHLYVTDQTVLTNTSKDFFGEKSVYVHYKNISELTDQTTIDVLQYIAIEQIINPLDDLTEHVNDPIIYESDYSFLSILLIGLYS